MKRKVSGVLLIILLAGMLYTVLKVRPGAAWSNGGFSGDPNNPNYGTHDWIAQHALDWLPTQEKQYILDNLATYLYGTELPDNGGAPDGIGDTIKHHIYYNSAEVMTDDAAAVRARAEYNNAFGLLKEGDFSQAAKRVGIMSHYIVDMAVFGHMMGSGTDWGIETHHQDYESYVNERTSSYNDEFNVYLVFDGTLGIISAYDAAKDLAYDTTFDVDGGLTCLWMDQNYNWSDPVFKNRCGESLNLAVNYLADVLHTFYADVTLYVAPSLVEYWTPNYGTTFTVDIEIANVERLYGFEFKLCWNTTLLDLMDINIIPPSSWGTSYFVGMNDTREDLGRYWLVIVALNPTPSFHGSTTLAQLTFKITYDPIYPQNVTSLLDLADTYLSDENGESISHDTIDGEYWLYSTKPTIQVEPSIYTAKKVETFNVNVTVSDVVDLYSYEFSLTYNTSLLDVMGLQVGNFLEQPYSISKISLNDIAGVVTLGVASQGPAPAVSGNGLLATITFRTVAIVWPDPIQNTTLHLNDTLLKTNLEVIVPHEKVDGFYEYTPILGDVNSDGAVNIVDLRLVASAYGTQSGEKHWDPRADLKRDGEINLFDLVLVSKNYGRTDP